MVKSLQKISLLFFFTGCALHINAQVKELNDDQYFKNNFKGIISPLPAVVKWTDNSHFLLMKSGKAYVVDAKTGAESEQTTATTSTNTPVKPSVFLKKNDLFIKIDNADVQLTSDTLMEVNATMSPDGNYVAYTKNNDLYSIDIKARKEIRLTNDGSAKILNGFASWVYMEEILGRASNYKAFWWSPDSKHVAFFRSDDSDVPVFTMTDGKGHNGYVETVRYPKVGDKNPEVKIGIISPAGGKINWADFNSADDQYFGTPHWMPDGSALLLEWANRKQNVLKIWKVDPTSGGKTLFYNEEQKTWVDLGKTITFLPENKGLLMFNDESGWQHIYHYDLNGKLVNQVTSGKYTVNNINYVDAKKGLVYFTARSRENSARNDFYKVKLNGKDLKRLTFGDFTHTINLSPDASYFTTNYQNATTPSRLALVNNAGQIIREIADSKDTGFSKYQLAKSEVIRVKSDDGLYDLPMKITWPVNMDKSKKYPVLISAYGGPGSTTLMDTWSLSSNQQWYAKEGIIQVQMDHRASGHFGKEGMNYMYHNLGYWEVKDYTSMVKWLINNASADSTKIGIVGFSYGGYLSAYALTFGADVFTHGMAGGTVSDWSLYDTHYTERYMGTKADNAEGYRTSSVLTYTDKYKGMLQIVHGVIDENVHLQNSLQLISDLQDKKKDFEFMVYPGGRHGWGGNKGLHFQNLKTKFIYNYLLEKPVPKNMWK